MFKWVKGYISDSEVQYCGQDTIPYLKKKEKWIWTIKKLLTCDLIGKAVEYSLKGY